MYYNQVSFDIRFEWGERGIRALSPESDVTVIVDVLSFSTCVDIATARGAVVYPFRGDRSAAMEFTTQNDAILASPDRHTAGYTLSPASLVTIAAGTRLVLPSPNGSTLTWLAAGLETGVVIYAACLRNASAVAAAISRAPGRQVAIIAAGERWPGDKTLRPAVEDLIGAGAVIDHLGGRRSPEALAAQAAYQQARARLPEYLRDCGSGRELIARGFVADVDLATELDSSDCAPRLVDGAYIR